MTLDPLEVSFGRSRYIKLEFFLLDLVAKGELGNQEAPIRLVQPEDHADLGFRRLFLFEKVECPLFSHRFPPPTIAIPFRFRNDGGNRW